MKRIHLSLVVLGGLMALFQGCGNDERFAFVLKDDVLDLEARRSEPFESGEKLMVDQMAPSNVIVAVNGYPFTKKAFDEMIVLKAKGMMEAQGKNTSKEEIGKELEAFRKEFPRTYLAQRLMIDDALAQKVVTKEEVRQHVEKSVIDIAKKADKPVSAVLKPFGGQEKYFYYDLAVSYVMAKLIKAKIPPRRVVDQDFVTNVQAIVRRSNAAATATNAQYRARMETLRKDLFAKKCEMKNIGYGKYRTGTYEEDEMSDPAIAAAAFKLKAGELSQVLEDEESYVLIRCVKIKPAEKDEEGRLVAKESRTIEELFKLKEELLVEDSELVLTRDLKNQLQMQAVNKYVENLLTNKANRVEYPHGSLWFK